MDPCRQRSRFLRLPDHGMPLLWPCVLRCYVLQGQRLLLLLLHVDPHPRVLRNTCDARSKAAGAGVTHGLLLPRRWMLQRHLLSWGRANRNAGVVTVPRLDAVLCWNVYVCRPRRMLPSSRACSWLRQKLGVRLTVLRHGSWHRVAMAGKERSAAVVRHCHGLARTAAEPGCRWEAHHRCKAVWRRLCTAKIPVSQRDHACAMTRSCRGLLAHLMLLGVDK